MHILEPKDVTELLRAEIEKAGSQSAWARKTGVQRSEICKVLHGKGHPNEKMIRALGLRAVFVRDKDVR